MQRKSVPKWLKLLIWKNGSVLSIQIRKYKELSDEKMLTEKELVKRKKLLVLKYSGKQQIHNSDGDAAKYFRRYPFG